MDVLVVLGLLLIVLCHILKTNLQLVGLLKLVLERLYLQLELSPLFALGLGPFLMEFFFVLQLVDFLLLIIELALERLYLLHCFVQIEFGLLKLLRRYSLLLGQKVIKFGLNIGQHGLVEFRLLRIVGYVTSPNGLGRCDDLRLLGLVRRSRNSFHLTFDLHNLVILATDLMLGRIQPLLKH